MSNKDEIFRYTKNEIVDKVINNKKSLITILILRVAFSIKINVDKLNL